MIRVDKIVAIEPYYVICLLNNGVSKKIDIEQLIKEHSKLNGIIKLKDINYLKSVQIGNFGEIYWSDTIKIKNTLWNYDISPEFIYHHGLDF